MTLTIGFLHNNKSFSPRFVTTSDLKSKTEDDIEALRKEDDKRIEYSKKEAEIAADILRVNCACPAFLMKHKKILDERNKPIMDINKNIDNLRRMGIKEYLSSFLEVEDDMIDIYPGFVVENPMFYIERSELPEAALGWSESEDKPFRMFEKYLKNKGKFYSVFACEFEDFFKNKINDKRREKFLDAVQFQKNYALSMMNPTIAIIKNEAGRVDIINTFNMAERLFSEEENMQDGVCCLKSAIQKTEEFKDNIDETLESKYLMPEDRLYFNYQKKIAETMLQRFNERYETVCGAYEDLNDDINIPDLYAILTDGLKDDKEFDDKLSDREKQNIELLNKTSRELGAIARDLEAEANKNPEFLDENETMDMTVGQMKTGKTINIRAGMVNRLKNIIRACAGLF